MLVPTSIIVKPMFYHLRQFSYFPKLWHTFDPYCFQGALSSKIVSLFAKINQQQIEKVFFHYSLLLIISAQLDSGLKIDPDEFIRLLGMLLRSCTWKNDFCLGRKFALREDDVRISLLSILFETI